MTKHLIIFEDSEYTNFHPLSLSHPVFALRTGAFALWERIVRNFPDYTPALSCRPDMEAIAARETGLPVNKIDYKPGDRLVFVNGCLRLGEKLTEELKSAGESRMFREKGKPAAIVITGPLENQPSDLVNFTGDAQTVVGTEVTIVEGEFEFYHYIWDLIRHNANDILRDYEQLSANVDFSEMLRGARIDASARILTAANLFIGEGAEIGANCVIDNTGGPIMLDDGARVGHLSLIQGPCYIGKNSRTFRSNIREGCSFGPHCRVGGEVEASIFHGYTNKYHDGFMGHAYLGSWVNLGALTTNSDLKNNYSEIKVRIGGKGHQTGQIKIGSFIGDHTKTGIGTLLNTGVSIGFSCNIFGGKLVIGPEIPSFRWGDGESFTLYRLEKAMDVARKAMARRNLEFTAADEQLFKSVYRNYGDL